ncbi:MAG: putative Ribonuclease [Candidatus Saccharibacteria bacterium]|nr:putative Ribonuclease [Candidatus Saccharibacteria bacterium]
MSTTSTGRKAEVAARVYLEMRGYKIIEQNFRRSRCEIDIVAQKDDVIHFVEVKYRKDYGQGGGLEAITASKLRQMRYGAAVWVEEYKWNGEYVLSAVEIAGEEFSVMAFIENVI